MMKHMRALVNISTKTNMSKNIEADTKLKTKTNLNMMVKMNIDMKINAMTNMNMNLKSKVNMNEHSDVVVRWRQSDYQVCDSAQVHIW
jgi:hypothetical protein